MSYQAARLVLVVALCAFALGVAGVMTIQWWLARRRLSRGWPKPSVKEVREMDKILRRLAGVDEAIGDLVDVDKVLTTIARLPPAVRAKIAGAVKEDT